MQDFEKAKALFFDGLRELELGRPQEAERCFRGSLALVPDRVSTMVNLSSSLLRQRRAADAGEVAQRVLAIDRQAADGWLNLGLASQGLGDLNQALDCMDRALQINPAYAEAFSDKGVILTELQRLDEALACHAQGLTLNPGNPQALTNMGVTLSALGRLDDAMRCYDEALLASPGLPDATWNQALIRLAREDFRDGWRQYEYRWSRSDADPYLHPEVQPLQDLAHAPGKRVLLWAEQGLGDTLQFSRYVALLTARGASVTLEVPEALRGLLGRMGHGATVVARNRAPGPFDWQLPLMSLPRLFGTQPTDIPAATPCLSAPADRVAYWGTWFGEANSRPRIGIAVQGNPRHRNDLSRSMPLAKVRALAEIGDVFLIQTDVSEGDRKFLALNPAIQFLGDRLDDFDETAAIVHHMDVVVSVDTSLAHLAGAMGKRLYVLLPWIAEWRWRLQGDTTPWYPSATLLRQPVASDWDSVVVDLVSRLRA